MKFSDTTPDQQRRIAALIGRGTSYGSLRHIAAGRRGASAEMAVAIERAAARIGLSIPRESLNAGCKGCEFAKTCRKAAKAAL